MRTDKLNRAITEYTGFTGTKTIQHVMSTIPDNLCRKLTGKQVGQVMTIRNNAYNEGKACGLEIIDECVWTGSELIPRRILNQIKKTETRLPGKWIVMTGRRSIGAINLRWTSDKTKCDIPYHSCPIDGTVEYYEDGDIVTKYTLTAEERF